MSKQLPYPGSNAAMMQHIRRKGAFVCRRLRVHTPGQEVQDELLVRAVSRVSQALLSDELDQWTELRAWAPDGWPINRAIGIINLARLSGALSLLPVAVMSCTRLSDIARGFTREDGSQEVLAPDDLDVCFKAKTELRKASMRVLFDTLAPTAAAECKTPPTCSDAIRAALIGLHSRLDDLLDNDPFFPYTTYVKIEDGKFGVCDACLAMLEDRCWLGRQKLWDRLPEVLRINVPGWGEAESTE